MTRTNEPMLVAEVRHRVRMIAGTTRSARRILGAGAALVLLVAVSLHLSRLVRLRCGCVVPEGPGWALLLAGLGTLAAIPCLLLGVPLGTLYPWLPRWRLRRAIDRLPAADRDAVIAALAAETSPELRGVA